MNEKEVRWKERRNKPGDTANKYFSICDEVLVYAERVVIPAYLQNKILKHFYARHSGMSRSKSLMISYLY